MSYNHIAAMTDGDDDVDMLDFDDAHAQPMSTSAPSLTPQQPFLQAPQLFPNQPPPTLQGQGQGQQGPGDYFEGYHFENDGGFTPEHSLPMHDANQWESENEESFRRRVLFEADQALTQLEVCYNTAERFLPWLLRTRPDGSASHLVLARHHLRQTITLDLQGVLFPGASASASSSSSSSSSSLSSSISSSMPMARASTPMRLSTGGRVSHSALTPTMGDMSFGSMSEDGPMSKKRARVGGEGDSMSMSTSTTPKRGYYDAQSVRAGKVPAALSNTAAPTMIYQFDLKAKGKRRARKPAAEPSKEDSLVLDSSEAQGLRDFDILNVLGVGTYGTVRLCRHRPSQQTYCVKVLSRQLIYKHKQTEHLKNEKSVLLAVQHSGIVKCVATGHDLASLFLVLEYVPGGELFQYIRRLGRLAVPAAKFYAAEILITLDYLHSRGIVYRDLKPENILLDELGHTKLTDFGFAKIIYNERTWTMCGTPDYIAPEVIACTGHGTAVDWWSYGVLLFEMLAGYPPFTDPNTLALFAKIKEPHNIKYPPTLAGDAIDLIQRILIVDPVRRLGAMAAGAQDIANHPWFYGVNWRVVAERTIAGPIRPLLRSADDFPRGGANDAYDPSKEAAALKVPIPGDVQNFFDSF